MRTSSARGGFLVAVIGPDGAGKTSICEELSRRTIAGRRLRYLYMGHGQGFERDRLPFARWTLLARSTLAVRRAQSRSPMRSWWRAAEIYLGGLLLVATILEERVRSAAAQWFVWQGEIVISDRYFLADYFGYEMGPGARRLHVASRIHGLVLRRTFPAPDLTIHLDVPLEVLALRRPGDDPDALRQSRDSYAGLATLLPDLVVVDATRTLREMVADIEQRIASFAQQQEAANSA